ncbi:hypothetical protein, partial [Leifsonia aquatica]|uniref:hypothetical protein n=1 Tax=Leifsonia aquatica TaxID=144185 RepID=UPI0028AFCE7B
MVRPHRAQLPRAFDLFIGAQFTLSRIPVSARRRTVARPQLLVTTAAAPAVATGTLAVSRVATAIAAGTLPITRIPTTLTTRTLRVTRVS